MHEDGRVLGQHKGVAFYTIGQRRGMGISNPTPLYVKKIDIARNRIIVGENASLFRNEVEIEDVNWVGIAPSEKSFEASVKIRYKHEPAPAMISPLTDKKVRIIFRDKQRAITPGQSAVFYDNDILLGGGIIS